MLAYEVFVHVRRIEDHHDVHTDKYQADARHTYNLLRAVDPHTAHHFALTYDLPPEDTTPEPRMEAHP